jgi:hypothetical protein
MRIRLLVAPGVALVAGLTLALAAPPATKMINESFEGREPLWVRGAADATVREAEHNTVTTTAHHLQRSEHILLDIDKGSYVHYTYDVGRAPITDELQASLYVKANRPGVQLLARVVLPHEPNPERIEEPLTVLIRGDTYTKAGRWEALELRLPSKLVRDQQALLRAAAKGQKDFNIADAYIDRLILNVYSGTGKTEVFIDELVVGPVIAPEPAKTTGRDPKAKETGSTVPRTALPDDVKLDADRLVVRGDRYFFRMIRHTDTRLDMLRLAGFNTIYFEENAPQKDLEEAAKNDFLVVPSIPLTLSEGETAEAWRSNIDRFAASGKVLFWDAGGGGLAAEQLTSVQRLRALLSSIEPQRAVAADVWDGVGNYKYDSDLVGVHRWPLGTGLEFAQYREWLTQRRDLARPKDFLWTWIQTHLPDWYTSLVYDRPGNSPGFDEPIGPQPEQIWLMAHVAVGAGCRGLGFWSDRFLSDSHQGRDRLLMLALLNQELQLLEPMLVRSEPPRWIPTSKPEVQAAMFRCDRGYLIMPVWMGPGSQYVPGQSAVNNLKITVPVPRHLEAWEVTPADVHRVDNTEHVVGGQTITLHEFGLTTAIVFTADNGKDGLLVYLQKQVDGKMKRDAAQWAFNLADAEFQKVRKVHEQLEEMGHRLPDGAALMAKAWDSIQKSSEYWEAGKIADSYHEAQRALRPLRILMRAEWDEMLKDPLMKDTVPVGSPYAVSYYTLPRQWKFMGELREGKTGANVLPNGDFEVPPGQAPPAWVSQQVTIDDVTLAAERVADDPKEGKQCLRLTVKPKDPNKPLPGALERTFMAIHSPAVRLDPGTLVKVSGWIKIPKAIQASSDGALFYDSAGGEPLAVRLTDVRKWQPFTLYRRVPASGTINVTMALTGIGTVYFDDVRIEPLTGGTTVKTAKR